ncbi:MAG: hypothetical protein COA36_12770 [Desulfotalea sp.]|nr:MAG: hypothetical protein COA36_12770 [Desulfotalea sp.]
MSFPEDSIQILSESWWEKDKEKTIQRGCLVWAYVAYPDQEPLVIEPTGRKEPREHGGAHVTINKLSISARRPFHDLPTAALSLDKRECWAGYRAKKRPCLVLSCQPLVTGLAKAREKQMAKHLRTSTILVAPYYGGDQDGSRGGFPEEFLEQIRHARCPQLFFDQLPTDSKVNSSIMRFDHMQTIGSHYNSYELTGYKLTEEALSVVDEWLDWFIKGGLPSDGIVISYQDLIRECILDVVEKN